MRERMPGASAGQFAWEVADAAKLRTEGGVGFDSVRCAVQRDGDDRAESGDTAASERSRSGAATCAAGGDSASRIGGTEAGRRGWSTRRARWSRRRTKTWLRRCCGRRQDSRWFRWKGSWISWRRAAWSRRKDASGCEPRWRRIFCGRCRAFIRAMGFSRQYWSAASRPAASG